MEVGNISVDAGHLMRRITTRDPRRLRSLGTARYDHRYAAFLKKCMINTLGFP